MKIRVYVRVETIEVLLVKKNKDPEWLADEIAKAMSMSSYYTMKMVRGERPMGAEVRGKLMEMFRGMKASRGRPCWDDFFKIQEAA